MNRTTSMILGLTGMLIVGAAFGWGVTKIGVGERSIPYRISDGKNTQTGVVKYEAYLLQTINETGKPSTLTHPIDDRQCSWTVEAYVDRVVCFSSLLGGESCNNKFSKSMPVKLNGYSNGRVSFLDHDPCSDYTAKINEHTAAARAQVSQQLQAFTDADLNGDLKSTMSGAGTTVTYGGL